MKKIFFLFITTIFYSTASAVVVGIDFENNAGYSASFAGVYNVMLIHSSTSVSIDPSPFLGSNNTILYDLSTDDLGPAQYITQNGFAGTFSSRGRWLVDIQILVK